MRVLNEVLLPAMKEVGDKFGAGELILPFVLQSAEVMKKAVAHLEKFLERKEGYTKGKVVLATVYGDVHDIGKSLVNTILSNNGYTVFDLGKQVPVNTIIDKAMEVGADAIGLSALLVSTSKQMPLCVQELDRRGLDIPGAHRRRGDQPPLRPPRAVRRGRARVRPGRLLLQGRVRGARHDGRRCRMPRQRAPMHRSSCSTTRATTCSCARHVGKDIAHGDAPAAAQRRRARQPGAHGAVLGRAACCATSRSTRCSRCSTSTSSTACSGAARGSGPQYEKTVREEFEPDARAPQRRGDARQAGSRRRRCTATSRCRASGNDLIVYDPGRVRRATADRCARSRASTSRARKGASVCASPTTSARVESGDVDVVAFQIVTVGDEATRRFEELQAAGEYTEAYYSHGLAVEAAEAVGRVDAPARSAASSGIPAGQGKRYSWGYGACPDLEDHAQLFKLLPADGGARHGAHVGVPAHPEQSTAAIVVHHPQAKYYAVRGAAAEPEAA